MHGYGANGNGNGIEIRVLNHEERIIRMVGLIELGIENRVIRPNFCAIIDHYIAAP